jgi:steroid Delta-isomerase
VLLAGLLGACGRVPVSLPELNASYDRALARSAPLAVAHQPGSESEQAVFERLQAYFTNMSAASVAAQTALVYAPEAYLNDTLVGLDGAARIQAYFSHTMQETRVLNVRFLDRAWNGIDCFVRWEMRVEHGSLADGKPVLSYGVTQFRFDPEGRVLLHKDFWDSGTGLYEQLPFLGKIIARVRAVAEQGAE